MNDACEINFDGLVGPTHNYAGLSEGNLASARNKDTLAHPRAAALQGLAKMRALAERGLPQGVLPPQERPNIAALRAAGFVGADRAIWEAAWAQAPHLARRVAAASSMWAANAATISPSVDTADARLHVTPANLVTMAHRALEADETRRALMRLMPNPTRFAMHEPLPAQLGLADEGAANHMRLALEPGAPGVEVFVYGRSAGEAASGHPARQTLEACQAIAQRHGLDARRTVFVRQSRRAIDAGAFHNDVVAASNGAVLLFHELAFEDKDAALAAIASAAAGLFAPVFIEVSQARVSLAEAVSSYLFNAQLVRMPGAARMTLVAPEEARENASAAGLLADLARGDGPIGEVMFLDVRQSMRNGGGPACLRLRIEMTGAERRAAEAGFFWSPALDLALGGWIVRHYRDRLAPDDLRDPCLLDETRTALDELTRILPLGREFYAFQRL